MSTPSLLNIPYRFKAGTLYSQLPETGAGDFTVTRATTPTAGQSTRVNAAGLIELVADNVPRLDYPLGGAVNGCPALLVEPSAINICLRSTWVGGGAVPTGWSSFITGTSTPTTSLLGNDSVAYSFLATSQRAFFSQTITISNATNYTFSFYVESITTGVKIDEIALFVSGASSIVFVDPDGITISATTVISKIGRYQVRMLSTSTSTEIRVGVGVSNATTASFVLSRPQLETGSVPTSYIPTTTAAVTRSADVISRTSASALIGQSEGTLYAEFFVDFNNRDADIFSVDGGSTSDGFFMSIRNSSVVQLIVRTASTNALIFQRAGTYPTGVNKLAVAYKNGDFAICLNGTTVQTNTSSITMPSVSINRATFHRNGLYTLNQQLRIRAAAIYPNRLTNAELAALTAL